MVSADTRDPTAMLEDAARSDGSGASAERDITPDVDLGWDTAYAQYRDSLWLRFSLVAAGISVVMVPIFSALDWVVYPDEFRLFLALRVACAVAVAGLVSVSVVWAREALPAASIASLTLIQVMIGYMIFLTDGPQSGYYAGLNLPIIGLGLFLPATVLQVGAFCLGSATLYGVACALHEYSELDGAFVEHLFSICNRNHCNLCDLVS